MFVEKLTNEEAMEIAKYYLLKCKENTWYIDKDSMERGKCLITFNFEIYEDCPDWIILFYFHNV
jgi:hypothetical protein